MPASLRRSESLWLGPQQFAVRLTHMPDFDQRRAPSDDGSILGLPNNGSMYCVPTSIANLAGYASNHGYSFILDGPRFWPGQSEYPFVTEILRLIGVIGNTSPTGGTTLNGMQIQARALFPEALFTITVDGDSLFWAPKVSDLAEMVHSGGLVSFCHGWYTLDGNFADRSGGHCITFTRGYRDSDRQEAWARDPADVPNDALQSPFVERKYDFTDQVSIKNNGIKLMSRIFGSPDESAVRLIDGYCLVKPRWGLSFQPGSKGPSVNFIGQFSAGLPLQVNFDPPGDIVAIVSGPQQQNLYAAIVGDSGGMVLHYTDILNPRWIELPIPLPTQPQLELANDRCILALGDGTLQKIVLDVEAPKVVASMPASANAVMSFDRATSRVVLLDLSSRRVSLLSQSLSGPFEFISIPGSGPYPPNTSIEWDDTRGGLWVLNPQTSSLQLVSPLPGIPDPLVEDVELPGLVDPTFVQLDDAGHLLVLDEGRWKEFMADDAGNWTRNAASPFDGTAADRRSIISRSRTNYDPELHPQEDWINILPETFAAAVPDCPADLDLDGMVGFSDVLAMLSAWGPCPDGEFCDADLDGDMEAGFGDLLTLLTAWGDCG